MKDTFWTHKNKNNNNNNNKVKRRTTWWTTSTPTGQTTTATKLNDLVDILNTFWKDNNNNEQHEKLNDANVFIG